MYWLVVLSHLCGVDRWVPVKLINPSSMAVTLRRNCKIADVFPCVAVEELPSPERFLSISMMSHGALG